MRHGSGRHALLATGVVTLTLLLSACSSSPQPTASHPKHRPSASPTPSTSQSPSTAPTSGMPSPSQSSSSSAPAPLLGFDPTSGGRHSHTCMQITGATPVDYVYYPVIVTAGSPVTLDDLSVTYADGVQVAGSWVAPATANAGTGFIEGWPAPSILAQSSSVQWSKRVVAKGAALAAGTPYNVFLHLRVYPDALPLKTDGVVLTYHDAAGAHTDTWVDHVTYQAGKC